MAIFTNPFTNPYSPRTQQLSAIEQSLMRLQAAGQKPPERRPNPLLNAFISTLEFIDRPRDAVVSGITDFLRTGSLSTGARSAIQALKGQKDTEGAELLDALGVDNKLVKGVGGFVTDIALDPLTWLGGVGLVTRPATSAVKSTVRGATTAGLESLGVKGAREVLERASLSYGKELVDDILKRLGYAGSKATAARAVADEAIRQAANRGFSKAAAEQFAEYMVKTAAKSGITPDYISSAANLVAKNIDKATKGAAHLGQLVFDLEKASSRPLDIIGNRLANIISRPAAAFGEAIGNLGGGRVGQAAVSFSDWLGRSFNRNYARLMPAGLKEFMADYDVAVKALDELTNSSAFRRLLDKYPDLLEKTAKENAQRLTMYEMDLFNKYMDLKDYLAKNPYKVYKDTFVDPPLTLINEAKKDLSLATSQMRQMLARSPLAQLPKEQAEQLADIIETPLNYINDVIRNNNATERMRKFLSSSTGERILDKLYRNGIDSITNLTELDVDNLVSRKILAVDEGKELKRFLELRGFANRNPELANMKFTSEVLKRAKKAVEYTSEYEKLLKEFSAAPLNDELLQATRLVMEADKAFIDTVESLDAPLREAIEVYLDQMESAARVYNIPAAERRRYYVPHIYRNAQRAPSNVRVTFVGRHPQVQRALNPKVPFIEQRIIPTLAEARRLGFEPVEDLLELQYTYEKKMTQRAVRKDLSNRLIEAGLIQPLSPDLDPGQWVKDFKFFDDVAGVKNMAIHKETYELLKNMDNIINDNKEIKQFWRVVDKFMNIWKTSVTALRPAWHVQNTIGNVFNCYLAGLRDPSRFVAAKNLMDGKYDEVTKYIKKHMDNPQFSAKHLHRMFRREVGEGFGKSLGDTAIDIAEEVAGLRLAGLPLQERISHIIQQPGAIEKLRGVVAGSRNIGENIETNAKLALFIDRIIKGDSPEQAGKIVKAALFDYTDITQVEHSIRRFVPFYTYTRKNLPFQLTRLMYDPEAMRTIAKIQQNIIEASGMDTEHMPAELQLSAFPINENTFIYARLPWDTLATATNPRELVSMLTPLLKTPIELATNRQLFTDKEIVQYPSLGVNASNVADVLAYLANQFGASRDLAGIAGAATATDSYSRRLGYSVTPPIAGESDNPMLRALGMALYPVIRRYNPENAQRYSDYEYSRQLRELIQLLQEQGIDVPTLREISGR